MGLDKQTMKIAKSTDMNSDVKAMGLVEYEKEAAPTDLLSPSNLKPVFLGLYGEVGGIMTASKKLHREKEVYTAFRSAVQEELGDTLWYFSALCRRLKIPLAEVFDEASGNIKLTKTIVAGTLAEAPIAEIRSFQHLESIDHLLLQLGRETASLFRVEGNGEKVKPALVKFAKAYLKVVQANGVPFATILHENLKKVKGRFLKPDIKTLPNFDRNFPEVESLPNEFEIEIIQRPNGRCYLRWNNVFIGDPLTDNIRDRDGYRFHDIFHFSYAAVLHWSPAFRALIKHKRKSVPEIDETQDSGRAIVVEEGLSAYIFSCAKELNFFENQSGVSLDLLNTVGNFVRGYEVEACPLKLWEDAILQGYSVFRQVRANNGGIIVGNRTKRKITYRELKK